MLVWLYVFCHFEDGIAVEVVKEEVEVVLGKQVAVMLRVGDDVGDYVVGGVFIVHLLRSVLLIIMSETVNFYTLH